MFKYCLLVYIQNFQGNIKTKIHHETPLTNILNFKKYLYFLRISKKFK